MCVSHARAALILIVFGRSEPLGALVSTLDFQWTEGCLVPPHPDGPEQRTEATPTWFDAFVPSLRHGLSLP